MTATMSPGDWIAFAGLMVAIISGGVTALAWVLGRISTLDKSLTARLTRVETMLEIAFPEARERAAMLDSTARVNNPRGRRAF